MTAKKGDAQRTARCFDCAQHDGKRMTAVSGEDDGKRGCPIKLRLLIRDFVFAGFQSSTLLRMTASGEDDRKRGQGDGKSGTPE
jgi:hypothetical protein